MFCLDPTSTKPLYQQLRESVERGIAAGHYTDGTLPSSRELARELGISRNTVNLAYQELQAEGFITSRPRSGMTVNTEIRAVLNQKREETAEPPPRGPDWRNRLSLIPENPFHGLRTPANWYTYTYPFLGGQIATELFPAKDWLRAMRDALEPPNRVHSLHDARFYDDPVLVQRLRTDILPSRGIDAGPDEILVTSGSQQALHLVGAAVVRDRGKVAVENPGYADAHLVFRAAGFELAPIPVDRSGIQMTAELERAQMIYVTPSHQLPTCATLSAGRRRRLLKIASESDALVIEDDYDAELRYVGRPTPALKALDSEGRVIYVGSFSKLLAPGLRLGFVIGAPELIAHMRELRRFVTRHPAGILQRTLALFIASGGYQRWLRRHRNLLKRKWERINEAASVHLPWPVDVPTGGTGLWVVGPKRMDAGVLAVKAARASVLIEHGAPFHVGTSQPINTFRLGFVAIPLDRIEPGLEILGREIRSLPRRMRAT